MVVILVSFLWNYDNSTLKLHQGKRSYLDERWLFYFQIQVGSVPGASEASKKSIKIHHEYEQYKAINKVI